MQPFFGGGGQNPVAHLAYAAGHPPILITVYVIGSILIAPPQRRVFYIGKSRGPLPVSGGN